MEVDGEKTRINVDGTFHGVFKGWVDESSPENVRLQNVELTSESGRKFWEWNADHIFKNLLELYDTLPTAHPLKSKGTINMKKQDAMKERIEKLHQGDPLKNAVIPPNFHSAVAVTKGTQKGNMVEYDNWKQFAEERYDIPSSAYEDSNAKKFNEASVLYDNKIERSPRFPR